ncbi:thioredoxin domain-containing protein [Amycolatopsis cynarae]|uniref:Thioredoxin domain-containing protein n=1 Tax=Amycolatopsis cynarae TaxID=2995223 RepID=A0ABY7B1N2_9PSEU|nr:thioredoxin domain-containing protein [Amycolatopsis sp. HUAS 11-8]WAL64733.1 thioredoxin domain-containing protein [Amycolatopsis sp. HUAS 11-8]
MGGAERSVRKRQQQSAGARAVAQARGSAGGNRRVIVAVVAVVVLAAVVIGGVLWTNASKNNTAGQAIPPQTTGASLDNPAERQGVVVVSGKADAKVKVDIYADFLCPYCGQLQKAYGSQIEQQIKSGNLQVSYHMIPLLNNRSDPPGYSLDSANAALCAADQGKFTPFHDSLFASQPEEGKRGYDKAQLTKLGQDLGITAPEFGTCVNNGTYDQQINAAFQQLSQDPSFQGTPTVLHNGTRVDWTDPNWLTNLVNQA